MFEPHTSECRFAAFDDAQFLDYTVFRIVENEMIEGKFLSFPNIQNRFVLRMLIRSQVDDENLAIKRYSKNRIPRVVSQTDQTDCKAPYALRLMHPRLSRV
jgi:hypothetical protein